MIWKKCPRVFDNFYVDRGYFPNLDEAYHEAYAQEAFYGPVMHYFKRKGYTFDKGMLCVPDEHGICESQADTFIFISW